MIDAAGGFLDHRAAVAAACGWSDLKVFGCNPDLPNARIDCLGLMLLDYCEFIIVDEHDADVETNTGVRQRFYRRALGCIEDHENAQTSPR